MAEQEVYSSGRVDPDDQTKRKAEENKTYSCPHCDGELRRHEDSVGTLHCTDPRCNDCCFYPPAEWSEDPRERVDARPCPMRKLQPI